MTYGMNDDLTGAVQEIERLFPEITFTSYGGAVPVQAEGTFNNKAFYFRFRSDHGSLTIGEKKETDYIPSEEIYVEVDGYLGDGFAGFLTPKEFKDLFILLMKKVYKLRETYGA